MAITTADDWFAAARENVQIRKTASATTVAAQPSSLIDLAGNPGAGSLNVGNTANGIVPTDLTAGFPLLKAFGGGATGYLGAASFKNSVVGGAILYDRLFHVGSISLTALATTTLTAQPSFTSRLPGGVAGSDLEILLEINTAVSATATTVAVGYTNETATTGRSTGASVSLSGFATRRIVNMPLQAGDKAVTRIDSVTVGGTVATAGTVNVIIARRLAQFDIRAINAVDLQAWDMTGAPVIFADSALWLVSEPDGTSSGLPRCDLLVMNG